MALSASTKRTYSVPGINSLPVKASAVIYEGSVVGLTSGYARPLTAGDQFGGFALAAVTGTAADGGVRVEVQREGLVQVSITAAAVTDIGKQVYASDDGTFTLTQSTNTPVGRVHRWVETGVVVIAFNADECNRLTGITALTDSTTGAASNTVDDSTSSVKDDIASLAAKINEIINRQK